MVPLDFYNIRISVASSLLIKQTRKIQRRTRQSLRTKAESVLVKTNLGNMKMRMKRMKMRLKISQDKMETKKISNLIAKRLEPKLIMKDLNRII